MSKELEMLEKRAAEKCIRDHDHIDSVVRHLLSRPFSDLRKYEHGYKYIRNDLCNGFDIDESGLDSINFSDLLLIIGYTPGNTYFDVPDGNGVLRIAGRKFNASSDSYLLALAINHLSKKDIRLKEFTHIGFAAFMDYLDRKIWEECEGNRLGAIGRFNVALTVRTFKYKALSFMESKKEDTDFTVGELMTAALNVCGKSWVCSTMPLDEYFTGMVKAYEILNGLFMDSLRMPLVYSGRERFREIIREYGCSPLSDPVKIDYETCYEQSEIIKQ